MTSKIRAVNVSQAMMCFARRAVADLGHGGISSSKLGANRRDVIRLLRKSPLDHAALLHASCTQAHESVNLGLLPRLGGAMSAGCHTSLEMACPMRQLPRWRSSLLFDVSICPRTLKGCNHSAHENLSNTNAVRRRYIQNAGLCPQCGVVALS